LVISAARARAFSQRSRARERYASCVATLDFRAPSPLSALRISSAFPCLSLAELLQLPPPGTGAPLRGCSAMRARQPPPAEAGASPIAPPPTRAGESIDDGAHAPPLNPGGAARGCDGSTKGAMRGVRTAKGAPASGTTEAAGRTRAGGAICCYSVHRAVNETTVRC